MEYFSKDISRLVSELSRLPGVGQKSAQRLAFHIINAPKEQATELADAIVKARNNVHYCKVCCTLTDQDICPICASEERDHRQIMVVENSRDMSAYERTGKYKGVYHVLHGAISPMLGIGPPRVIPHPPPAKTPCSSPMSGIPDPAARRRKPPRPDPAAADPGAPA